MPNNLTIDKARRAADALRQARQYKRDKAERGLVGYRRKIRPEWKKPLDDLLKKLRAQAAGF